VSAQEKCCAFIHADFFEIFTVAHPSIRGILAVKCSRIEVAIAHL